MLNRMVLAIAALLLLAVFIGKGQDSEQSKAEQCEGTEITNTRNDQGTVFVSNHVNVITVQFYGNTAVVQGSETWEMRNATSKRGSYV